MSTRTSKPRYFLVGLAILLAVLLAGCAAPSGPAPVTTQATPATTTSPATPVGTTVTTVATTLTATATTPPATTTPTTTAAPTTPPPMPPVTVTILNFAFSPASVTVPRGTTVTWTNRDAAAHTVVNDGSTTLGVGQKFSSPSFGQGQNYSFTFTDAGTYPYHCGIHLSMHGTVIVM